MSTRTKPYSSCSQLRNIALRPGTDQIPCQSRVQAQEFNEGLKFVQDYIWEGPCLRWKTQVLILTWVENMYAEICLRKWKAWKKNCWYKQHYTRLVTSNIPSITSVTNEFKLPLLGSTWWQVGYKQGTREHRCLQLTSRPANSSQVHGLQRRVHPRYKLVTTCTVPREEGTQM